MRVNVYVPQDLKQQMDSVEERTNWSALACDAFHVYLRKIAARNPNTTNMQDTIERLRAAQEMENAELEKIGIADGIRWAEEKATPRQLRRLEKSDGASMELIDHNDNAEATHLYCTVEPNSEGSDKGLYDFWKDVIGLDDIPEDDYVIEFAKGALNVWNKVKDKI